jgi:hypothetical protein
VLVFLELALEVALVEVLVADGFGLLLFVHLGSDLGQVVGLLGGELEKLFVVGEVVEIEGGVKGEQSFLQPEDICNLVMMGFGNFQVGDFPLARGDVDEGAVLILHCQSEGCILGVENNRVLI